MAGTLTNGTCRSAGTWLETLESGSLSDGCFLDDQFVSRELVVVLGIGDGALKRLTNEVSGFLGRIGQGVEGIRDSKSLNFTNNVACFLRRNPSVFGGRTN